MRFTQAVTIRRWLIFLSSYGMLSVHLVVAPLISIHRISFASPYTFTWWVFSVKEVLKVYFCFVLFCLFFMVGNISLFNVPYNAIAFCRRLSMTQCWMLKTMFHHHHVVNWQAWEKFMTVFTNHVREGLEMEVDPTLKEKGRSKNKSSSRRKSKRSGRQRSAPNFTTVHNRDF